MKLSRGFLLSLAYRHVLLNTSQCIMIILTTRCYDTMSDVKTYENYFAVFYVMFALRPTWRKKAEADLRKDQFCHLMFCISTLDGSNLL